ncbi:MAG: hypothetical protein ACREUQ_07220 [Burkholderiales bacterium]
MAAIAIALGGSTALASGEGLRFSYEPAARFAVTEPGRVLAMRGEVQPGDLKRLGDFIRGDPNAFVEHGGTAVFVVDGGDVLEAIHIGELLQEAMLHVWLPDVGSTRCLSACFFMFASAVSRDAVPGSVGIHRPHLDEQRLAGAQAQAVRSRYRTLMRDFRNHLDELSVPGDLIEKMLRTPWNESYRLSEEDLERLGRTQPWFEDYAAANCGVQPALARRLREAQQAGFEVEARSLRSELLRARGCLHELLVKHRAAFVESLAEQAGSRSSASKQDAR